MEPDETLRVRPGTQSGWTLPLTGEDRCRGFGHELQPTFTYRNGLLIGYCSRCDARAEVPWFRGGTVSTLALYMASEALRMTRPAESVEADLAQVEGLLREDRAAIDDALKVVAGALAWVMERRSQPPDPNLG